MRRRLAARAVAIALAALAGFAVPVIAQQPTRPITVDEAMGALKIAEEQRDFAQRQASAAGASANRAAGEQRATKAELDRVLKICGEACQPPADAKK